MKILIAFLFFLCTPVFAAPFLVSGPTTDTSVDICAWQEGTVVTRTPLVASACHADLAAVTAGAHSITVWFESSVWGTQSAVVPFSFSKPSNGAVGPTGIGISKN